MSSPWRPPQWNKPATVMVTVPPGYNTTQPAGATDPLGVSYALSGTQMSSAAVSYVFDAVLALEHDQTLTKTRHPVQFGAAVSSHAYIEPATVALYVLMSDVVGQYVASSQTSAPYISQFTGNPSKSVSAYQQMLTLQKARYPLTITTRLRTYTNMLITKLSPREDDKTVQGARFRIEFEQVFLASTQVQPNSVRPNDTNNTSTGSVNPTSVPTAVQSQFGVSPFAPGPSSVPGNGTGVNPAVPFPPDLGNGSMPVIDNGVPGYLSAPESMGGPATPVFTPQYPNTVTAVDVPGAGNASSSNYNTVQASQP